jgi:hypothetical protein
MSAAERATAPRVSAKAIFGAPAIVLSLLCAMYFITYVDRVNIGEGSSRKPFPLSLAQGSGDFGTMTLTFARYP